MHFYLKAKKALAKIGTERRILSLIGGIHQKPTAGITLGVEILEVILLKLGTRQR
jgi:hypothetical protein